MNIKSELPLFLRANAVLDRMQTDMTRALDCREALDVTEEDVLRNALGDSIARSLHNIYCGIETILEDIAETVDGGKPSGSSYHRMLLDQMSVGTKSRPAVIDPSSDIRDLMRFRHVFRKVYGENFRIPELVEKLNIIEQKTLPDFLGRLNQLKDFLEINVEDPLGNAVQETRNSDAPNEPEERKP